MLGGSCSACCCPCSNIDGKPCTDPADEGTWVPVTPWPDATLGTDIIPYGGIGVAANWSFVSRQLHGPGNTWFFYGSIVTSKIGGDATLAEAQDWGNLCNWYSAISPAPPPVSFESLRNRFVRRATRLPDEGAVIHVYSPLSTVSTGPRVVKSAYFWNAGPESTTTGTEITATDAIMSTGFVSAGVLFYELARNLGTINGGAIFIKLNANPIDNRTFGGNGGNARQVFPTTVWIDSDGIVNGGAVFSGSVRNWAIVNGGAEFLRPEASNRGGYFGFLGNNTGGTGIVNGGAIFRGGVNQRGNTTAVSGKDFSATVNGGAIFDNILIAPGLLWSGVNSGTVNGGAEFFAQTMNGGTVNGGAVFNHESSHLGFDAVVNGGAIFNDDSLMRSFAFVNGGAQFFDRAIVGADFPTVNGGATFNDAACSNRTRTVNGVRFFVAHPADFPTCNGTAPPGSDSNATCGCN